MWQKLAAFQQTQEWPQNVCQARICYFRDKVVVFAHYCKFANLIYYDMQYIPCNGALLTQETLFLPPKEEHFFAQSLPKSA